MKTQDIINMGLAWKQVTEMSSKEKMKRGLYNSYVIPEDVPVDERDMFMAKAAAAHKAGQSHFTMNGKKHPVTMKKDTAKAVNSSTNEDTHKSADKKPEMYVDPNDGKKKVRMVPHDKAKKDKDEDEMDENKKMALQKALQKSAAPSAKGKAAVTLPKPPFKVPAKEEVEESTDANQELEMHTEYVKPNSVSKIKDAMIQMWQEANDRAMHMKGATKPEEMKDKSKSSKGAMDMMKTADDANTVDELPKAFDDVSKAGQAGPKGKARPNDNMKGDKSIVNPVKKT